MLERLQHLYLRRSFKGDSTLIYEMLPVRSWKEEVESDFEGGEKK
jgi:hypothetical protein